MTYIDYMNQLWRSSDKVPMPASEIALYSLLVNLCNLQYWKMPVICSTLMICEKLHLSKQTVNTIRKDLADRGLISYDEGKSRFVPSKYYLLKLTDGLTHGLTVDLTLLKNKNTDNIDDTSMGIRSQTENMNHNNKDNDGTTNIKISQRRGVQKIPSSASSYEGSF